MATQTPSQRQAAAQKAAATRKRTAAKRSASTTKSSARRTRSSASATTRQAGRTTRQATRTASKRADAAASRLGVVGRQAQRALLIQLGAAATLKDKVRETARTYSNLGLITREFDRFERRGNRALSRGKRTVKRDAKQAQRTVERQWDGLRSDAEGVVNQVRQVI